MITALAPQEPPPGGPSSFYHILCSGTSIFEIVFHFVVPL